MSGFWPTTGADCGKKVPVTGVAERGRGTTRSPSRRGTDSPLVIGHRGASGYRPEHTLAGYELAARLGADYLEPDLVPTKDGVLVCRHEPEIGDTTDVADHREFAARKRTAVIDDVAVSGWFVHDFTLAELKTLRVTERLPTVRRHATMWDGRFEVPTFAELLDLRRWLAGEQGRSIGVYPETKHPSFFRAAGLPLEPLVAAALRRDGLNVASAPVHLQSFEASSLKELRRLGVVVPLVQLLEESGAPYDTLARGDGPSYADMITPAGLASIAGYAGNIGPDKAMVIPQRPDGTLGAPTGLVARAHEAGLRVHPYTFRAENTFLPPSHRLGSPPAPADFGRAVDEQLTYLRAGVDGLFTDHPDLTVHARGILHTRVGPAPASRQGVR